MAGRAEWNANEMSLEIFHEKLPPLQVVRLKGRLDSAGAPRLSETLETLEKAGETRIVLECSELRYISSVGLSVFIGSGKSLGAAGGALAFAGLTPHVRSMFEMVGFIGLFPVYVTVDEAIASA